MAGGYCLEDFVFKNTLCLFSLFIYSFITVLLQCRVGLQALYIPTAGVVIITPPP